MESERGRKEDRSHGNRQRRGEREREAEGEGDQLAAALNAGRGPGLRGLRAGERGYERE